MSRCFLCGATGTGLKSRGVGPLGRKCGDLGDASGGRLRHLLVLATHGTPTGIGAPPLLELQKTTPEAGDLPKVRQPSRSPHAQGLGLLIPNPDQDVCCLVYGLFPLSLIFLPHFCPPRNVRSKEQESQCVRSLFRQMPIFCHLYLNPWLQVFELHLQS